MVGLAATWQPEVQRFVTTADPHATVGGSFTVAYAGADGALLGETAPVLHDAPAESLRVALEQALPSLGAIRVSRAPHTWCACRGAFEWTVTFLVATGDVQALRPDGAGLTGAGARASDPEALQEAPWLNGTFRLALRSDRGGDAHYLSPTGDLFNNSDPALGPVGGNFSVGPANGGNPVAWTRPLAVDGPPGDLALALREDLGLAVHAVAVAREDEHNGREYAVTFASQRTGPLVAVAGGPRAAAAAPGFYTNGSACVDNDLPQLVGDAGGVGGFGAGASAAAAGAVWVHTARNGSNPVWGTFTLGFRESGLLATPAHAGDAPARTPPLRFDASAADLERALEALGSVGDVEVTREGPRDDQGNLWAVTFVEVRRHTRYGWVFDGMSNLEALVADDSHLHGTGARVEVGHREGGAGDYPHWAPKREGSFGEETGAAYVFQRSGLSRDQYQEVAKVTAHDHAPFDKFGWSTALSGGGRPWRGPQGTGLETGFGSSASGRRPLLVVGAPSKYDGGVFEQQGLSCAADGGHFRLRYRGFTSDPIPHNVTHGALVEHLKGRFGPCLACHAGATADPMHVFPAIEVEPWGPPEAGLCAGRRPAVGRVRNASRAVVTLVTPPARRGSGGDLEMLEADASGLWLDDGAAFFAGDADGGAGAGRAPGNVTVDEVRRGTAISSGPEARGAQKGAAYVFSSGDDDGHGLAADWRQQAKLQLPSGGEADRFGWAVAVATDGKTLAVAAPGEGGDVGAVYVFQRDSSAHRDPPRDALWGPGEWRRTQRLDGSVFSSAPLDRFGEALALSPDGNTIVVGSPGHDGGRGAAYVFLRHSYSGVFQMHQQLTLGQVGHAASLTAAAAARARSLSLSMKVT